MQFELAPQARPFVYVQYGSLPQSEEMHADDAPSPIKTVTSPSPAGAGQEPQTKQKRQQVGYACDKCRERRVGCDRGKSVCGQCRGKYKCIYSNHALRLDNVSMRQRMDEMQTTIQRMSDTLAKLETDYHSTIPEFIRQQSQPSHLSQHQTQERQQLCLTNGQDQVNNEKIQSVADWAIATGWLVTEQDSGLKSIQTNITNYDELRNAVRRALQQACSTRIPLFSQPSHPFRFSMTQPSSNNVHSRLTNRETKLPTVSVFESLGRFQSSIKTPDGDQFMDMSALKMDVMSRLICKHHQCTFPILVSPSRFERHYKQGELKSIVLSSLFCHAVPHACTYHQQLVKVKDFHNLGQKFYNHSRMELGLEENPNLSSIHQRTFLITYDLDVGRVRRAFLQLGITIRMCFALNLHKPEGYLHCKTQFEREQAKRIFWAIWFFDSMVPHFYSLPRSIASEDVTIELPTVLSDFDQLETDQTRFAISIIHVRQIASEIMEAQRNSDTTTEETVRIFEDRLATFYASLAPHLRYSYARHVSGFNTTIFSRRTHFCVLLDFCQCWITLHRPHLPINEITPVAQHAMARTSQAALAMTHIFEHWFRASIESADGFDCLFRPYLYHYMSAIQIFKLNTTKDGRSALLVNKCRTALVKLLRMYQTTPTYHAFEESQVSKDLVAFIQSLGMDLNGVYEYDELEDDLMDDPDAECGWGLFSTQTRDGSEQEAMSFSSGRSVLSPDPLSTELDMDYF